MSFKVFKNVCKPMTDTDCDMVGVLINNIGTENAWRQKSERVEIEIGKRKDRKWKGKDNGRK